MTRERDPTRVRDYSDLIHRESNLNGWIYNCGAARTSNHGVFTDEPTTCLWCAVDRNRHYESR